MFGPRPRAGIRSASYLVSTHDLFTAQSGPVGIHNPCDGHIRHDHHLVGTDVVGHNRFEPPRGFRQFLEKLRGKSLLNKVSLKQILFISDIEQERKKQTL